MTNLQKINLEIKSRKEEFSALLKENSLIEDSLESVYGIFDEADNLAACGGREKNILKCFAVKDEFKGLGLTDEILSALLKEAYGEGYKSFFIFTKRSSVSFFTGAGFISLASSDDSALLYRGENTIEDVLKNELLPLCPGDIRETENAAIVMNANPFTLGHRYLIEKALEHCGTDKRLLVFAVETDKSFFSFQDRFMLIKKNTEDLKNVIVLPSSQFLISSATFPSYFLKEKTLISKNQTQLDARIFLKYFVPLFNIKTRFLGEEPLDPSTEIYNQTLLNELHPKCEVKIIERKKTHNNKIISATQVRSAFQNNSLEDVRSFLPEATYNFLSSLKEKNN
ncbi:adenylyltransferase/cytidyltransferase family protein [Treponema sp. OMZ 799]|uniref:adenylyltransferase/cytidyltransferase family protein n=1 Tax=Treponema sp. OMZ 799 TaxID=2563668 RepID=UPI0020A33C6E|nr:adenylyltransferase/cytidyltransferase family protein [Treponema sp. OMZ 799]UTC77930.1 adenylyltransferase/cytidyltransferase family protein [Treponema sp. OMZ 799]